MIVMLRRNHTAATSHLTKRWQEILETKLALVEVHPYNPAHRKWCLSLVDVTGGCWVFRACRKSLERLMP
jgi:hypothetical protein